MNNQKLNLFLKKIIMLILIFTLKIILEYFYIFLVSPKYSYAGLVFDFHLRNYIFSWVIFILLVIYILKVKDPLCKFLLNLEFIVTILPLLVFYGLTNNQSTYIMFVYFAFCTQIYILKDINTTLNKVSIYIVGIEKITYYILFIISSITVFLTVYYNGFHGLKAFNTVYLYSEIRRNTNYPMLFSYLVMWTKVLLPILIIFNLYRKKKISFIYFFLLQLVFYMATGEKFIYLILLVIFSIYLFSRFKFLLFNMYFGLIILVSLVIFSKNIYAVSFMGERFLFGPAMNKYLYFDFFSRYPKIYFSDGLIGKALGLSYQYTFSSGQLIFGYLFQGRLGDSNSVTGMLGESFSQFGFLGMIFLSILFAKFIKFIIETTNGVPNSIRYSILSIFIILLNDTNFFTVFFSGGLFWVPFLFYIFLDKKFSKKENIIIIKLRIKDFIYILLKKSKIIFLGTIFSIIIALILSNISHNYVLSYSYLNMENLEFSRKIFKNVYEKKSVFNIIVSSTILGIFLSSFLLLVKRLNGVKENLKINYYEEND
ncbi:hypothetical protein FUSO5_09660 [Fusobacterium necrophorum BFTR-1]|uniref:O-antigen polymerase n=1 Tax=Fusobacterium necrophorum TaxID=859 RepID=UPI000460C3BD|nr:O-antigen polymerase [Fusobacterium necrophorum]KDE62461.1 hypothetical protein FUSO5_09660 [Fusobacterium necrophorum BFTR-1]MCF0161649.1 oligosaccharide repeat unit polymerase [Fusobacterium necrophorum]